MGDVEWNIVTSRAVESVRNLGLGMLFVDMAQTRALRSAGTLAGAMLQVEQSLIQATFAAMEWGQATLDAVAQSSAFDVAVQNVQNLETQLGQLKSAWVSATAGGTFLSPQALAAETQVKMFVVMHPGLEQQKAMVEQAMLMRLQLEQAQLHLAVSIMMLRENQQIARIAEHLLEVQMVASAVSIGAALGGGTGPTAALGAAWGLGVGTAGALGVAALFAQSDQAATNSINATLDMATNLNDASSNLNDLNASTTQLKSAIDQLNDTMRNKRGLLGS